MVDCFALGNERHDGVGFYFSFFSSSTSRISPIAEAMRYLSPDFHMCKGQEYVKVPESEMFVAPD